MWKRLFLAVFILLSIEVGLFLLMFPWSSLWEHDYFLTHVPALRGLLLSYYFRGALSGLGLVNIWAGLAEAWHFRDRLREAEAPRAADPKEIESLTH